MKRATIPASKSIGPGTCANLFLISRTACSTLRWPSSYRPSNRPTPGVHGRLPPHRTSLHDCAAGCVLNALSTADRRFSPSRRSKLRPYRSGADWRRTRLCAAARAIRYASRIERMATWLAGRLDKRGLRCRSIDSAPTTHLLLSEAGRLGQLPGPLDLIGFGIVSVSERVEPRSSAPIPHATGEIRCPFRQVAQRLHFVLDRVHQRSTRLRRLHAKWVGDAAFGSASTDNVLRNGMGGGHDFAPARAIAFKNPGCISSAVSIVSPRSKASPECETQ
jgi:hypothetical protein